MLCRLVMDFHFLVMAKSWKSHGKSMWKTGGTVYLLFGNPPPRWIQEPLVVRDRDGRPQEDPQAVHCFCVCSGSVLLGDLLGVSRTWSSVCYVLAFLQCFCVFSHLFCAPCGLRCCKSRPASFPGRMSYKATKPHLVRVLYRHALIALLLIRAPFEYCQFSLVCVLSFGCSS